MRILLIEDDHEVRNFLIESFKAECFAVDSAEDGDYGSYLARTNEYDILIFGILLPCKNGLEICKEIRASGKHTPIIILSIESDVTKKVTLLECGADDYVTKPFCYDELLARIKAILRRPKTIIGDVLKLGNLTVDCARKKVFIGKREIYLTRKEFALVEYLMKHRGYVVTRGMIMEHVWNIDGDLFSNTIEAHILNLRKKIDSKNKNRLIHTIPGRGYKMDLSA